MLNNEIINEGQAQGLMIKSHPHSTIRHMSINSALNDRIFKDDSEFVVLQVMSMNIPTCIMVEYINKNKFMEDNK